MTGPSLVRIPYAEKGQPSGVAELDADSKLVTSQIPKFPEARVHRGANQNLATSGSWDAISFDSEDFDEDAMRNPASPTQVKAVIAGTYLIFGQITFQANATGDRRARLVKNGVTASPLTGDLKDANSGAPSVVFVETLEDLALNDYVELEGMQTSGGGLNAIGGRETTFLCMKLVRRP